MAAVNAREIFGVFGHDFQQVIRRPRHQMTFQHIGNQRYRAFKTAQHVVRLARQGDFHEHGGFAPDFAWINQRDVARDEPVLFQPLHAAVTGRCGQVHPFRQFRVRQAAVLLQHL